VGYGQATARKASDGFDAYEIAIVTQTVFRLASDAHFSDVPYMET